MQFNIYILKCITSYIHAPYIDNYETPFHGLVRIYTSRFHVTSRLHVTFSCHVTFCCHVNGFHQQFKFKQGTTHEKTFPHISTHYQVRITGAVRVQVPFPHSYLDI